MSAMLLEGIRRSAAERFPAHGVLAAYAYGSRITGGPSPESDLDIGYYLAGWPNREPLALGAEMLLAADLARDVGVEVDLRHLGDAPLEVRGRVLEEGVRIFSADDVERVGLERDTLSRYHDYKESFHRMHEIRLRQTAERGFSKR